MKNEYLNPACSAETLDLWLQRRSILTALKAHMPILNGTLLDVGCGYMPYRDLLLKPAGSCDKYVGLDLEQNQYQKPDLEWDGRTIPLPDASVDSALATEVFEHCPDIDVVLREIFRVLKPKGNLFFTVPFLWPLHNVPYDECRYTPFHLDRHLRLAGFAITRLGALGGWHASMAQMIGLWVRRGPLTAFQRRVLSAVAVPVVKFLANRDDIPTTFSEGCMVTGLFGVVAKPAP